MQQPNYLLSFDFESPTPSIFIENVYAEIKATDNAMDYQNYLQAPEGEIPQSSLKMKRGKGRPEKSIEQAIKDYENKKSTMNFDERRVARNNIASMKYRRNRKEKKDLKKSS